MSQFVENPLVFALEEALAYLNEQERELSDVILFAEAATARPLTPCQMAELLALVRAALVSKDKAARYLRYLRARDTVAAGEHPLPP
jgi:hypothetical protein